MRKTRATSSGARAAKNDIRHSSQAGASMVEVLVALLIVSLGLLGIGGLSAATFGYNKTAQLRLTGLGLVNDYADRARLNIYGYDLGNYNLALADAIPDEPAPAPDEPDGKTAAENVAQSDRRAFMTSVADRLPQGRSVVTTTPGANGRGMDIWLLWQEPQTTLGDNLFQAGQSNCPSDLSDDDKLIYSCMYFKVGL